MVNLLNEEIRVIQISMTHLKRAIPLEPSNSKRLKMEKDYNALKEILQEKLDSCGEYTG